jgi:hypothetical protein
MFFACSLVYVSFYASNVCVGYMSHDDVLIRYSSCYDGVSVHAVEEIIDCVILVLFSATIVLVYI